MYSTSDNGTTWTYQVTFDPPGDRSINRLFGRSIALGFAEASGNLRLLIGAPGAAAVNLTRPNAGVAFMYQLLPNGTWFIEVAHPSCSHR